MSLLDRIESCHRHDLGRYVPFKVGSERIGFMRPDLARELRRFPSVFRVEAESVSVAEHLDSFDYRSAAIDSVMRELRQEGFVRGWRDELFTISSHYGAEPLFDLERAGVPLFGVKAYGVHVNGYVRRDGEIWLWVGRRAANRPIEPGKLDHLVAGGLPSGVRPFDNLIKEAAEEASIPKELARRARPCAALSYRMELDGCLRDDTLFVYDLELPADFVPRNHDGEIADFRLLPLTEVERLLAETDSFKFNVGLVIIDFLIRQGHLTPDRPDYAELAMAVARRP
jgi:8-oxo-dGTP pyrophosphatase MutT (NUDIX family)